MDAQLDQRLQAILDAAETAAINAGGEVDILPIRNEIEDAEDRLAGIVRERNESLGYRLDSLQEAIERLHQRVDAIGHTVEAIQMEMPEG